MGLQLTYKNGEEFFINATLKKNNLLIQQLTPLNVVAGGRGNTMYSYSQTTPLFWFEVKPEPWGV
jgi:hypothetical protein